MLVKSKTEEPCLVRNFSPKKNKNLSAMLQYRQCFIFRLIESTNFWFFIVQLTFSCTLSTPRLHPSYSLYFLCRYTALNPKPPSRNNSNLLLDLGGLLNVIVKRRQGLRFPHHLPTIICKPPAQQSLLLLLTLCTGPSPFKRSSLSPGES